MNSKNKIALGIIGIAVIVSLLTLRPKSATKMGPRIEAGQANKEQDLAQIKNPKAEFSLFGVSLFRLASTHEAAARDVALDLLHSKDKRYVDLAIRALGYFDEEKVNQELKTIVNGNDPWSSQQALRSLALVANVGSPRKEILEEYLEKQKKSSAKVVETSPEKILISASLYKMSSDAKKKSEYYTSVRERFAAEKNPALKRIAAQSLLQMNPSKGDRELALQTLKPKK